MVGARKMVFFRGCQGELSLVHGAVCASHLSIHTGIDGFVAGDGISWKGLQAAQLFCIAFGIMS